MCLPREVLQTLQERQRTCQHRSFTCKGKWGWAIYTTLRAPSHWCVGRKGKASLGTQAQDSCSQPAPPIDGHRLYCFLDANKKPDSYRAHFKFVLSLWSLHVFLNIHFLFPSLLDQTSVNTEKTFILKSYAQALCSPLLQPFLQWNQAVMGVKIQTFSMYILAKQLLAVYHREERQRQEMSGKIP